MNQASSEPIGTTRSRLQHIQPLVISSQTNHEISRKYDSLVADLNERIEAHHENVRSLELDQMNYDLDRQNLDILEEDLNRQRETLTRQVDATRHSIQKKVIRCWHCGFKSHLSPECYAKRDIDGFINHKEYRYCPKYHN
jgi:hypothetical protein